MNNNWVESVLACVTRLLAIQTYIIFPCPRCLYLYILPMPSLLPLILSKMHKLQSLPLPV